MTDLRRWSEEGATAAEVALLDASRRERPSARARAQTLRALGAAAAATTIATTAPTAAATKGGMTFLTKIALLSLVGAVGGGAVAGGLVMRAASHKTQMSSAPSYATVAKPASDVPPRNEINSLPSPLSPSSSTGTSLPRLEATARPLRPASSSESLTREVKALELAHRALAEHDAPSALDLLDRYRVQFPGGSLSSEATVLRVQALLQNGDRAGAQALVDGYVSAHLDSPYARRLKDIVRGQ
jgi:hypothetical protein